MNPVLQRLQHLRDAARAMTDEEADVLVAAGDAGDPDLMLAARFRQRGCADEPAPEPVVSLRVAGHAWEVTEAGGRQAVIVRDRASLHALQMGRAIWARCSHEHPVRAGQAEVIGVNPNNGCILLEPRIVALTAGDELLVAD